MSRRVWVSANWKCGDAQEEVSTGRTNFNLQDVTF